MDHQTAEAFVVGRYRDRFGATLTPAFSSWLGRPPGTDIQAALGYRWADSGPLFLERYLDDPVELATSRALNRTIDRSAIVELGNFAADNARTMIDLWGSAANDLAGRRQVAVATLTAPLRRVLQRIGVPLVELGQATAERGGDHGHWGDYYAHDPRVFAGEIGAGQRAIAAWLDRHDDRITA